MTKPRFRVVSHLSLGQTLEAIVHSQHAVALQDTNPDCSSHSCIHACTGRAHIQNGHVNITLKRRGDVNGRWKKRARECVHSISGSSARVGR